mgnify:CR=1 FL=1
MNTNFGHTDIIDQGSGIRDQGSGIRDQGSDQDHEPLISVLVTVYNVEKYLNKCVESIINQTYKNLEIILIDDGSTDSSPKICDEYAQKDSRIKVIHKKNAGVFAAKNSALDISTGDFIGFVDSDDYIKPEMYSRLYELLNNNNADMVICGFFDINEDGSTVNCYEGVSDPDKYINPDKQELISQYEAFKRMDKPIALVVTWSKLYKAEIFKNFRFEGGLIHEDTLALHRIINECQRIFFTPEKLYFHVNRAGSLTNEINKYFNSRHFYEITQIFSKRHKFFLERRMFEFSDKAKRILYSTLRKELLRTSYLKHIGVFNYAIINYLKMCMDFRGQNKISNVTILFKCVLKNIIDSILNRLPNY